MAQRCRCGECGRFTSHWKDDESFCGQEKCWAVLEGPHIPGTMIFEYNGPLKILPPRAQMCDMCTVIMKEEYKNGYDWW